jgi:hypothetical protein
VLSINTPHLRWLPAVVVFVAVFVSGCGHDRSGGPVGSPTAVVGQAPDRTVAAGTARVTIDGEQASATGVVDLAQATGRLDVRPGPADPVPVTAGAFAALPPSIQAGDPFLAIELLRGAKEVDPYGGAEVRGASTLRYTVKIDPAAAVAAASPATRPAVAAAAASAGPGLVQVDVFIDSTGRIRRLQLPNPLRAGRPVLRPDGEVKGVTIDYEDFGKG